MTSLGTLELLVHADWVPRTAENFLELCEKGYYDGVGFHRLVADFMVSGEGAHTDSRRGSNGHWQRRRVCMGRAFRR